MNFRNYIANWKWLPARAEELAAAGNRCRLRFEEGMPSVPLEAHHATYVRLSREIAGDLIALCRNCHHEVTTFLRCALVEEDTRPTEQKWRTCVHEAAHITVDVIHFGPDNIFATTTATGSRFGASVRTRLRPAAGTRAEYRKRLQVILAGRVGEELLLGSGSHGAGGETGSDLERATSVAAAMAGSLGLSGPAPLTYLGAAADAHSFLAFPEIRETVNEELAAAAACRALLEDHRAALEAVALTLSYNGRVDGAEVGAMLSKFREPSSVAPPAGEDDEFRESDDPGALDGAVSGRPTPDKRS
jgi:hypothetical protein